MGYVIIDGMGKTTASNPAPVSDLGNLYHAVNGQYDQDITINGYGQSLGPGTLYAWTPEIVANYVQSGKIFLDWCGWPMYYQVAVNGMKTTLGSGGFQTFASEVGYNWLNDTNFDRTQNYAPGSYPFNRGYDLTASQHGVYLPHGNFVSPGGIMGIGGGTYPLNASGFSALFALHPPGGGYYVYGTYVGFDTGSGPAGIPYQTYADFLYAVVHNQSSASGMTISHESYTAPPTSTTAAPTSPTSPYPTGTPTTTSKTSTTSGSSVGRDVAFAVIAVVGTGGTVWALKHYKETGKWW